MSRGAVGPTKNVCKIEIEMNICNWLLVVGESFAK